MLFSLISSINHLTRPFVFTGCFLSFFIFIISLILAVREEKKQKKSKIKKEIKKLWRNKLFLSIFTAVILLTFWLRILYIPHFFFMYTDEELYLTSANKLAHFESFSPYWKSIGWPFLIMFTEFFTNSVYPPLYLSAILSALTMMNVFILAYLITKREDISLTSAALYSLLPLNLEWAAHAETNPASVFFITLTLITMIYFYKKPTTLNAILTLSLTAFTAQIRPENYALFIMFIIGLALFGTHKKILSNKDKRTIKIKKLIILFLVFSLLSAPNFINVMSMQFSEDWTNSGINSHPLQSDVSANNIRMNLKWFVPRIIWSDNYPKIISALFIIGLLLLLIKGNNEFTFLLLTNFIFLVGYLPLWIYKMGGRSRMFLFFYPLISISSAFALIYISELLIKEEIKKKTKRRQILSIFGVMLVIIMLTPQVKATKDFLYGNGFKLETILINDLRNTTKYPPQCSYIGPNPEIITAVRPDVNNWRTNYFLNNINEFKNQTACLILVYDAGCSYQNGRAQSCNQILKEFNTKIISNYSQKYWDLKLETFRILTRKDNNKNKTIKNKNQVGLLQS